MKKTVVANAEEVMKNVEKQKDRPFVGAKIFESMEYQTAHTQGDVTIIHIENPPPMNELKEIKNFNGVIAEGMADSGNHCVRQEDLPKVKAYRWDKADEYQGPFIFSTGMWTLTHKPGGHKWATFPMGWAEVQFPQEQNLGKKRRQMD